MGQLQKALEQLCSAKGLRYIGSRGSTSAPVVVVGEAPGADENLSGFPFVGASGREQDKMMLEAGLSPKDCWFTNPYKIKPPDTNRKNNDFSEIETLGIPKAIFEAAFLEELREHKPTFIITAGDTPTGLLMPTCAERAGHVPITKWQGSLLSCPSLDWPHYIIPNNHPAFILRTWSERQISVLCYAKVAEELEYWRKNGKLQPLPERELLYDAPPTTVIDYLRSILSSDAKIKTSVDIEFLRRRVLYTIALAKSPASAISFGFWEFDNANTVTIFRLLNDILKTRQQIGQNYLGFDCSWLETICFEPNPLLVDDVLLKHHVLWPELSHTLAFMTMQYTREPYYKDDGHTWTLKKGGGKQQLKKYNAKDAAVTYEVNNAEDEEFKNR